MTALHTTQQAADRLGVHDGHVRRLAAKLNIGQHYGRAWLFTDDDIDQLRNRNQQVGRPAQEREEAE